MTETNEPRRIQGPLKTWYDLHEALDHEATGIVRAGLVVTASEHFDATLQYNGGFADDYSTNVGALKAPASASAARAARTARSEVSSPSSATWRWRMPVRSVIQASEVSIRPARSSLLTIFAGR